MLHMDPVLHTERNALIVGRAATGIFLILSQHSGGNRKKVLLPANLCYAGILPAQYAGWTPRFCDVDPISGNVTLETFQAAIDPAVGAAIVPHMYGQPVAEMPAIAACCHERGILLIEDCASAMGAEADYPLGRMGDYTVYSTGYSKTLELGYGGIVCSDLPLEILSEHEKTLLPLTDEGKNSMSLFSRLYRVLRNHGTGTELEKEIYRLLPQTLRSGLIHSLPEEQKQEFLLQLERLPQVVSSRRSSQKRYEQMLSSYAKWIYPFTQGAVPWRFILLLPTEKRKKVIATLLEQGLPVSDWYPRVTPLFSDSGDYPGAEWHEKHVINLPLLRDDQETKLICHVLIAALQTAGK